MKHLRGRLKRWRLKAGGDVQAGRIDMLVPGLVGVELDNGECTFTKMPEYGDAEVGWIFVQPMGDFPAFAVSELEFHELVLG